MWDRQVLLGHNSIPVGELGKKFFCVLEEDKAGKLGLVKTDHSLDFFQEAT